MNEKFYRYFLLNYPAILRHFQRERHSANCTALACAIDEFLSNGNIRVVSGFDFTGSFIQTAGTQLQQANLRTIINLVRRGENGNHLVIEAENSEKHHFANLIKINDSVYYVDGFQRQQPVCSENISGYLSWATIFHYSIGMRVRMSM